MLTRPTTIIIIISIITAIRLLFLFASPLPLSPDEAYYWDWSRHLAFGYYSKPPLIAWLIKAGTSILGNTEVGVRALSVLLGTISLIFTYLLSRELFGERAALWTLLISALTPASSIGAYIMTIDAPLIACWATATYFFYKAINAHNHFKKSIAWWSMWAITTGLGLLSKQTMIAMYGLSFLYLIISNRYRHIIKSWRFVLSIFFSILIFMPTILWNMEHSWITIIHTRHHFSANADGLLGSIKTFAHLFGSLFGILSPLTFLIILFGIYKASKLVIHSAIKDNSDKSASYNSINFAFIMGGLPLMLIMLLSFHQKVNANWPAPFFITSIMLGINAVISVKKADGLLRVTAIIGGVFTIITYLSPFIFQHPLIKGASIDPFKRLYGWKELSKEVSEVARENGYPQKVQYIFAYPRQAVSELAFYMEENPRVYMWKGDKNRIKSQYDLWDSPLFNDGSFKAILIKPDKKHLKKGQIYAFSAIKPLKHVVIPIGRKDNSFKLGYWIFLGEKGKRK